MQNNHVIVLVPKLKRFVNVMCVVVSSYLCGNIIAILFTSMLLAFFGNFTYIKIIKFTYIKIIKIIKLLNSPILKFQNELF